MTVPVEFENPLIEGDPGVAVQPKVVAGMLLVRVIEVVSPEHCSKNVIGLVTMAAWLILT